MIEKREKNWNAKWHKFVKISNKEYHLHLCLIVYQIWYTQNTHQHHSHLQLSSFCNWPSARVCPLCNIPSVGVKGTFVVLWSSANCCSSSKNMHYKAPVAAQHSKTNKVVWTWKDDWPPGEILLMKDLLPERVTT